MNAEWRRIASTSIHPGYRTGWPGVWDSLVSAITRRPRATVPTVYTVSAFIKGPQEVMVVLSGTQVEENHG